MAASRANARGARRAAMTGKEVNLRKIVMTGLVPAIHVMPLPEPVRTIA
jgi:hypothetical protein